MRRPGAGRSFAHSLATVVAATALLAGCGPEPGRRSLGITNGEADSGHPAVGLLIFSLSGGTAQDGACTATLVGSQTVLSAAHCVPYSNTAFVLGGTTYASAKKLAHPDYDHDSSPYLFDLALVRLGEAPPVAPMPISAAPPTPGEPISLVGFGETSQGAKDNNTKRLAANTIDSVEPHYFIFSGAGEGEGNACYGDSGGPVLVASGGGEAVRGVLSYITGDCGPSQTMASRTDVFLPWLQSEAGGDLLVVDRPQPDASVVDSAASRGDLGADRAAGVDRAAGGDGGRQISEGCGVATGPAPGPAAGLLLVLLVLSGRLARRAGSRTR